LLHNCCVVFFSRLSSSPMYFLLATCSFSLLLYRTAPGPCFFLFFNQCKATLPQYFFIFIASRPPTDWYRLMFVFLSFLSLSFPAFLSMPLTRPLFVCFFYIFLVFIRWYWLVLCLFLSWMICSISD
jgi:hypothetical protein